VGDPVDVLVGHEGIEETLVGETVHGGIPAKRSTS
jgi:hypothetical protein